MSRLAVFMLIILCAQAATITNEELRKLAENAKLCQNETGFTQNGAINYADLSQEGKCFITCLVRKRGEFSEDGFNLEKIKENYKEMFKNDSQVDSYMKIIETCAQEVQFNKDDICDSVFKFAVCLEKKVKSAS